MIDIEIRTTGNTTYMTVEDEIIAFTTNAEEIENEIEEYIEENDIGDVNISYI